MLVGQLVGKGGFFVSMMILSRYLDKTTWGLLMFAIVLGMIYLFLADLGISPVLNRQISIDPGRTQEYYSAALSWRIVLVVLGLLALVGFLLGAGYPVSQVALMAPVVASFGLESAAELQYAVFRARERMAYEGLTRAAGGVITLLLVIVVVRLDLGAFAAALVYPLRALIVLALALLVSPVFHLRLRPCFSRAQLWSLLCLSWPLGLMGLLVTAFQRLDSVIVESMIGVDAVGAYQNCYKLLETLVLIVTPTLLPGALFPGLCRAFEESGESARRRMVSIAQLVTGLSCAALLPCLSGGFGILRLLWGSDFLRGQDEQVMVHCYYLIVLAVPVLFWMNFLVASVIAAGRQKVTVRVTALSLTVNLVGNLLLVPRLGIRGAAAMVLISNAFMALLYYVDLRKGLESLPLHRELWRPLLALIVAAPVAWLTLRAGIAIRLLVPAAAFGAVWIALGGFCIEGKTSLKSG